MNGLRLHAPDASCRTIPALPAGWHVAGYAALIGGRLGVLAADVDLAAEWRRDAHGDYFSKAGTARAGIWILDDEHLLPGPEFPLLTPNCLFDRFPDGRWLVVSSRGDGPNARVLSADGDELATFTLGDGIMHIKVGADGLIWVGWFDEGVFGNRQWRVPGRKWPPSSFGLAAFDERGALVTQAEELPRGSEIADCYALNVTGDAAWACTFPDFPIGRLAAQARPRWWPIGLSGVRALAVRGQHVLAFGGYGEDGDRAVLFQVDEQAAVLGEWRLPLKGGFPQQVDFVDARGDALHVVHDGVWTRWRVADFLAVAR